MNLSVNSYFTSYPSFWLFSPISSCKACLSCAAKRSKKISQNEEKSEQIAIDG